MESEELQGESLQSKKDDFLRAACVLVAVDSSNCEKEAANSILANLYVKSEAWQIVIAILNEEVPRPPGVLFTAAKVLRVKLFYYFSELQTDYYQSLFTFLLSILCLLRKNRTGGRKGSAHSLVRVCRVPLHEIVQGRASSPGMP